MVKIIKNPGRGVIRTFRCSCGCVFEADDNSYRTHRAGSDGKFYEEWHSLREVKFFSCYCPNCGKVVWTDSLSCETRKAE